MTEKNYRNYRKNVMWPANKAVFVYVWVHDAETLK